MSFIQAAARARMEKMKKDQEEMEMGNTQTGGNPRSPSKTVLAVVLGKKSQVNSQNLTIDKDSKHKKDKKMGPPQTYEDVPFRRQDRRILNARKKRLGDRKLCICLLVTSLIFISAGCALIAAWFSMGGADSKIVGPFILLGSVILGLGLVMVGFTTEIFLRLKAAQKKVLDHTIDTEKNLHHIKHWVLPDLIPYGWGNDEDDDAIVEEEDEHSSQENRDRRGSLGREVENNLQGYSNRGGDRALYQSSRGAGGQLESDLQSAVREAQNSSSFYSQYTTAQTTNSFYSNTNTTNNSFYTNANALEDAQTLIDELNPHETLAVAMSQDRRGSIRTINSDIFDESLRYSNVDRPTAIKVHKSSPIRVAAFRGDFQSEEERIANLFATKTF